MAESNRDEIAKLESMFAANPEGRVFTHLAEAYRKAGELERARDVLNQGLQRHQDSASGYVVLGRVLQDSGEPGEATTAFARVLELDPENRVALRALGELAHAGGEHERALGFYEQLRTLDPSDEGVEGVVNELRATLAAAPPVPEPVAPLYPESAPPSAPPPPQFTPADFPQDLGSFDLSGFDSTEAPPAAEPSLAADLGPAAWMKPTESTEPATGWGEAALPSLSERSDAPESSQAAPLSTGPTHEEPFAGDTPPFDSFSLPAAAEPALPEPAAVEGLERVEEPGEVAPIEGLEPADEVTGALPPIPEVGSAAPFAPPSAFGGGDVDDLAEAPFGEPASAEMMTETMAELYRSQGHLVQAAEVYRALLRDRPGDEQLERKLLEIELAILSPEPAGAPVEEPEAGAEPGGWGEPAAEPEVEPANAAFAAEPQGPAVEPATVETRFGTAESGERPTEEPASIEAAAPEETATGEAAPSDVLEAATAEPGAADEWALPAAGAAAGMAAASLDVPPWPVGEQPEEPADAASQEAVGDAEPAEPAMVAAEPPVPAMEEVWSGSGDVATSDATPYAWESGPGEEASGPPVSGYLHALLAWHRSTNGSAEAAAAAQPQEAEPQSGAEPAAAWTDPWTEAPQATQPEEPASPWSEPPADAAWTEPAAAAEPTWADEAADSPEPWTEPDAAPAWEETPPAQPEAAEEPAGQPDMAWLLGPEGIAPEKPATSAPSAEPGDVPPGDDDDLEMFRAWLQSLKK